MSLFGWLRRGRQTGGAPALGGRGASGAEGEANPLMLIHGRTRTAGVPYALPRDTEEINRLDFQHYMLRYAFQGLYAAPLGDPASILDVGTGTGRWAIEMAELFPAAQVVGLDVNPPPPDERADRGMDTRPPNYQFTPGNILEGLPFPTGAFDFVHMRLLFTGMPLDRWPSVIGELARVARPDGWVESVESANLLQTGPAFAQVQTWLNQVVARRGVDIDAAVRVGDWMRAAGLVNVQVVTVNLPTGAYGGRIGTMMAQDILSAFNALKGFVAAAGIASESEFDALLAAARAELNAPTCRTVTPFHIAYGQRPA
jgi:ubiquinone/menaquinone biosynthesis C-methylase UbiE